MHSAIIRSAFSLLKEKLYKGQIFSCGHLSYKTRYLPLMLGAPLCMKGVDKVSCIASPTGLLQEKIQHHLGFCMRVLN